MAVINIIDITNNKIPETPTKVIDIWLKVLVYPGKVDFFNSINVIVIPISITTIIVIGKAAKIELHTYLS